jgi:phosphatidylserine/phosphatidylglycerophosphate/cardiolipin synthase-like enzyme
VKVVVIVEYVNFFMKRSLVKELKSKGGILIKPNPISTCIWNLDLIKAFNRYHQKVHLVDDDLFIGSINSSDEYSGIKYGAFQYIDLNLYIKKTPCKNKILLFFKNIVLENKKQIKERVHEIDNIFKDTNDFINEIQNEKFLEETSPDKTEIQDMLYNLLESSKESITLIQCYYLNIKKIEDILIRAMKRGVKVKIITAEKRDQHVYKYIYNQHLFSKLLKNGAEVYEFLDKSFHMKAYQIDNTYLTLGSFNNDISSFVMNNEANYLIERNHFNTDIFRDFKQLEEKLEENCRRVEYIQIRKLPRFRLILSYLFYLPIYIMEKTITNRKIQYQK